MNYKLIAIDMDGTLLNSKGRVTERNKEAIRKATEKGVKVVISTGRIFTSAMYYARLIGLVTPIIACNGAYVSEYHRDNVILENPIDKKDIIEVFKVFEEKDLYYHFYDNENFYTRDLDFNSLKYYKWNEKQPEEDRINIEIIKNPIDFINKNNKKIYKIVVMDDDVDKIIKTRKELSNRNNIDIVSSWHGTIDIMFKGVSKGNALEELCKLHKIKEKEVIAIGDNENDLSMLKFAGTSVAMKNGIDIVKDYSDIVTDSNDEDGVAKVIEKLIK